MSVVPEAHRALLMQEGQITCAHLGDKPGVCFQDRSLPPRVPPPRLMRGVLRHEGMSALRVGSVGSALPIVHAALFLEKWRIAERASLRDMPRVPPLG